MSKGIDNNRRFEKFLSRKEVQNVLIACTRTVKNQVSICSVDGQLLVGKKNKGLEGEKHTITYNDEAIGYVSGGIKTPCLARMLSYLFDQEMEKKSLVNETLEKYKEIILLQESAEKMSICHDVDGVVQSVINEMKNLVTIDSGKQKGKRGKGTKKRRLITATSVSIMLFNEKTKKYEIAGALGKAYLPRTALALGEGIGGVVAQTGLPEIVNNVTKDKRYKLGANDVRSLMCIPLSTQGKVLGLLNVSSITPVEYTAKDLKFFTTIALQTSIAMERAKLYEELKETFYTTVATLVETIEMRDPYTGGHVKRVVALSLDIGKQMGLSKEELDDLRLGGMLHDIGKIGIPDTILFKPGILTDEEFDIIKEHPERGVAILKNIDRMGHILPAVKWHHERFDGRGYPDHLVGKNIPIIARIIAVADSFDAMISDRVYRKGIYLDAARQELKECSGTQFDADVVEAFLKTLDGHSEQKEGNV